MSRYNPSKIEKKWQKYWETKKIYNTEDNVVGKKNFMMLTEFPYTSGNLHIGHWFTYSIADIFARYLRMIGYNVMNPIGFDAFGLPAENAAIKHNTTPELWTKKNINYMSKQLKSIGATFDWSRIVDTSKPDYYKWTQWIFLKLYEKGLACRAETKVNWCPKDKTVLANEQVVNGLCERCDTLVVKKDLTQWMFKITDYSDALIDDIKDLDWPETTKLAQINWIGRSDGAEIKFNLTNIPDQKDGKHFVEVFTTRPDTIFGATFVVMSPELAKKLVDTGWKASDEVEQYITSSLSKRELERQEAKIKTGINTGIFAINPANDEKIPVWVADYVLGGYGTGAIMAVPAHDERDREFAQKFNLSINNAPLKDKAEVVKLLKDKGAGKFKTTYRLRDWVLSRQRYWGVPIPMINCPACGYQPVVEEDLPVKLPPLKNFKPADDGRSPLAKAKEWLKVKCSKCGGEAEKETDTMDTFVDSSWYFMRYTDPKNKKEFASKKKMSEWLPVPMYIGGREHNTMHLLYARFITKALHGLGLVDFNEPFLSRRNHGVIMGPDGKRMSKSKGNVVDPDIEVKKYGIDAVRINFAFMGPFDQDYAWNNSSINGIIRFLNRIWNYVDRYDLDIKPNPEAIRILNKFIKEIGEDINKMSFNTGVSGLMKLLNELESHEISKEEYETFLKLLAPFAPHIAEELWHSVLKNKKSIHLEKWPEYDEDLSKNEKLKDIIGIDGTTRFVGTVDPDITDDHLKKIAIETPKIKGFLESNNREVVRYVIKRTDGKIVTNLVTQIVAGVMVSGEDKKKDN